MRFDQKPVGESWPEAEAEQLLPAEGVVTAPGATQPPDAMVASHPVISQGSGPDYCSGAPDDDHVMESVSAGEKVRWVERCMVCGWIDTAALDRWADNAVKEALSARAARIAIAGETQPFAFVQSSEEELKEDEVLFQALGAASVCWVGGTGSLEFDSSRAKSIGLALLAEVQCFRRLALEDAATRAIEFVSSRSGVVPERELGDFRKHIEG